MREMKLLTADEKVVELLCEVENLTQQIAVRDKKLAELKVASVHLENEILRLRNELVVVGGAHEHVVGLMEATMPAAKERCPFCAEPLDTRATRCPRGHNLPLQEKSVK